MDWAIVGFSVCAYCARLRSANFKQRPSGTVTMENFKIRAEVFALPNRR
jgi:hypothetical protein